MGDPQSKLQRLAEVAQVFTPGTPIDRLDLFAGRFGLVRDVINALNQRGQHVVLYGERGVGKTSLANVLSDVFARNTRLDLTSIRVNCNSSDDFASLWRTIFRRLKVEPLADHEIAPERVREVLEEQPRPLLIVIDELDRLGDDDALSLLADTIKALSDHAVRATIVLVGVADSIDDLVGDHRSVERALVQVKMPRMSRRELVEIVEKGIARLGMGIDPEAKTKIASLSEGLPHYTHLLGLHAAQSAIMDDRQGVTIGDVDNATRVAVEKAQQSILGDYHKATRSPRKDNLYKQVLLACALAPKDELGYFAAGGVRDPMSRIMGEPYEIPAFARHLNEFTTAERGSVLSKEGQPRKYFYRFANPLLQPFVILHGLSRKLISEETLAALHAEHPGDGGSVSERSTSSELPYG